MFVLHLLPIILMYVSLTVIDMTIVIDIEYLSMANTRQQWNKTNSQVSKLHGSRELSIRAVILQDKS
jgi:hypothetical protein